MLSLAKKIEVDEKGRVKKILIPWNDFKKTSRLLGFDHSQKEFGAFKESWSSRGPINIGIRRTLWE